MPDFVLQLDPAEIDALALRFGSEENEAVLRTGAAARTRGHYTRSEFLTVCEWKSPRSRPRVQANDARAVRMTTARALSPAVPEQTRMEALLSLQGVGVPTASTLLHFAFPEAYPILDVRAVHALGERSRSTYAVAFWLAYLETCRELAARYGVSLRTLDKALWQWSKEQGSVERPPRYASTICDAEDQGVP
jgi:hypothetical protein